MFIVNEDLSIHVTRGDSCVITVSAEENGERYLFQAGDMLRMKVFEKKACENVVLQKDVPVIESGYSVRMQLTKEDTRIGSLISKPVDYWYEIELNPLENTQTIVGYDDNGPKVFQLLPEGRNIDGSEIAPEDIPIVDKELDLTSIRPVQNRAVTKGIMEAKEAAEKNAADILENAEAISGIRASVSAHGENRENPHMVTKAQVGLGNADDTSDMDKPVSNAQKAAIAEAKKAGDDAMAYAVNVEKAAGTAQSSANAAQAAADAAMDAAHTAQNSANAAQSTADNALSAAGSAQKSANNAQAAADASQESADRANAAAESAMNKANEMLPKSGGTMTGAIAMGGNKITGMADPTASSHAATKNYVDNKRKTWTATITTSWSGSSAPYTQNVAVSGIVASDRPHIAPNYSGQSLANCIAIKEAWACVNRGITSADTIQFVCFEDKPTRSIPVHIEALR